MLTSLKTAKQYLAEKATILSWKTVGETVNATEKALLGSFLEADLLEKLMPFLDQKTQEKIKNSSLEEVEGILFHAIPNYATLLEETVAEVLAEYLSAPEAEE